MIVLRRLPLVVLVFLVWAPAALAWSWPVNGPVLQPFAYDESHPYAAGQHRGLDIGAPSAGAPVVAPAAGTVAFAGTVPTSGHCVTIQAADGYSVTLTHLGSIRVASGATVAEGDAVGTVGPSGSAEVDGPYVHLGIRLTADRLGYVDPLGLLPAVSPQTAPSSPDPGAVDPPAPAVVPAPAAPPAPHSRPAPAQPGDPAPADPADPAASVDPPAADPGADATPADPAATSGDPRPAAGGRPAPNPALPATPNDFADLPDGVDRARDDEASSGDTAEPGSDRSTESVAGPAGAAGETSPRHARSARGRASEAPVQLPVGRARGWIDAGRQHPSSVPAPSPLQRPAATTLLALVLGVGPSILALAAALRLAAQRARRRAAESAVVGAVVVGLPRRHERILDRQRRRAA